MSNLLVLNILQSCFVILLTMSVCQTCWDTAFEACRDRACCNSLQACVSFLGDAGFYCHQLMSSCVQASGWSSDISKTKCRAKKACSRCRFLPSRRESTVDDGSLVVRVEHVSAASQLNSVITATMGVAK